MRIYVKNQKTFFNPHTNLQKASKSVDTYIARGKVNHAAYGKGTGGTTIGITSHPKTGMAYFPQCSPHKRSASVYNICFDPILLVKNDESFNIRRIFEETGCNKPLVLEMSYQLAEINRLCNLKAGLVYFSPRGMTVKAFEGTYNENYKALFHANRFPNRVREEVFDKSEREHYTKIVRMEEAYSKLSLKCRVFNSNLIQTLNRELEENWGQTVSASTIVAMTTKLTKVIETLELPDNFVVRPAPFDLLEEVKRGLIENGRGSFDVDKEAKDDENKRSIRGGSVFRDSPEKKGVAERVENCLNEEFKTSEKSPEKHEYEHPSPSKDRLSR